ncbi:protein translocase subunit SecD, partial [Streptomyces sp. NPDC006333]
MIRSARVRALLALALIAVSLYIARTVPVRLGLDLRGGTQIVLETRSTPTTHAGREATDRTLEVLRGRVDALGVAEPTLVRSGSNRIIVELPGVRDPKEAADVLGRTAQLTFHPVLGTVGGPADRREDARDLVLPDESGHPLRLAGNSALTGKDVKGAAARFDQETGAGWHVTLDFDGAGRDRWARLTGE